MQRGVLGAALQFSQGRTCGPQGKLAKRKRRGGRGPSLRVAVPCFCCAGRRPLAKSRPLPLLRLACFCRRQRLGCAAPSGPAQRPTGRKGRTALKAKAQDLSFNLIYTHPPPYRCSPGPAGPPLDRGSEPKAAPSNFRLKTDQTKKQPPCGNCFPSSCKMENY